MLEYLECNKERTKFTAWLKQEIALGHLNESVDSFNHVMDLECSLGMDLVLAFLPSKEMRDSDSVIFSINPNDVDKARKELGLE